MSGCVECNPSIRPLIHPLEAVPRHPDLPADLPAAAAVCRRQGRVGAVGHPVVRGAVFLIWPGRTNGCCCQAAGNPGKGLGQASCSRESDSCSSSKLCYGLPALLASRRLICLFTPAQLGEQKKTNPQSEAGCWGFFSVTCTMHNAATALHDHDAIETTPDLAIKITHAQKRGMPHASENTAVPLPLPVNSFSF